MEIFYEVAAHEVEVGDQIIVDLEPIEVTSVEDDPDAPLEGIRIRGYSHETGDLVTHDVYFDTMLSVWGI
jgi:hypothetical protein